MRLANIAWLCALLLAVGLRADDTASADLKLLSSGAMPKLGGYMPQRLMLSADKPGGVKKVAELTAPLYGTLKFGGKDYLIALDEPDDKDATLYVDANGNGDLTDDDAITWTKKEFPVANGKKSFQYMGSFSLPLQAGDKAARVTLAAYRFDKHDPQRAALKSTLLYYSDYAFDGNITLGGAKYHAMLTDDFATGDFRGKQEGPASGVRLLIDLNHDGRFANRGEIFDAAKPFNISGTTWKLSDMTAGGSFKIVKSDEAVAEIKPPPDHSPGKPATPFKAVRTDGKGVDFPADYKGKIVMLDFWATWCGPCMGEVPGLVENYNKYHSKGIEILGISLDQPNAAEKVKQVTTEKGMTWPQVYDGKFWEAAVAKQYGIESIPSAFLVDGDTGEILASGESLRGDQLAKFLDAALSKKAEKTKVQ